MVKVMLVQRIPNQLYFCWRQTKIYTENFKTLFCRKGKTNLFSLAAGVLQIYAKFILIHFVCFSIFNILDMFTMISSLF